MLTETPHGERRFALSHPANAEVISEFGYSGRAVRSMCDPGLKLDDGTRLRLPAEFRGRQWLVAPGDLRAFLAATRDVRRKGR